MTCHFLYVIPATQTSRFDNQMGARVPKSKSKASRSHPQNPCTTHRYNHPPPCFTHIRLTYCYLGLRGVLSFLAFIITFLAGFAMWGERACVRKVHGNIVVDHMTRKKYWPSIPSHNSSARLKSVGLSKGSAL